MGMYTFRFPMQFGTRYKILPPGGSHLHQINLSQAAYNRMDICSIHAVASDDVTVNTWMSNIAALPFDQHTLAYGWAVPATSMVGDLWVPCTSLPEFKVLPNVNYFQQFEFVDACSFLLFEFAASPIATKPVALSMSICFK